MTKYSAVVSRGDQFWLVHVPAIDQWTQAQTDDDVEPMARDLIATYLDVAPDSFVVDVLMPR
ncbi:HicB-like antitoxin [Mycobacterium phage Chris]|uniref:HicB-like antitoxin n=1 Tax=Mycobacterium phage Chris TaxID=2725626 RepID=A0A6M3SWY6_9CAUD|nr:HicB-like antitoxin [Mycobacterium phage Chris]QJD50495.1 HicB-like antitoxin [Mycobacterium phage Chris]